MGGGGGGGGGGARRGCPASRHVGCLLLAACLRLACLRLACCWLLAACFPVACLLAACLLLAICEGSVPGTWEPTTQFNSICCLLLACLLDPPPKKKPQSAKSSSVKPFLYPFLFYSLDPRRFARLHVRDGPEQATSPNGG